MKGRVSAHEKTISCLLWHRIYCAKFPEAHLFPMFKLKRSLLLEAPRSNRTEKVYCSSKADESPFQMLWRSRYCLQLPSCLWHVYRFMDASKSLNPHTTYLDSLIVQEFSKCWRFSSRTTAFLVPASRGKLVVSKMGWKHGLDWAYYNLWDVLPLLAEEMLGLNRKMFFRIGHERFKHSHPRFYCHSLLCYENVPPVSSRQLYQPSHDFCTSPIWIRKESLLIFYIFSVENLSFERMLRNSQ